MASFVQLVLAFSFLLCAFNIAAVQLYIDDEKDFVIYQGGNPTTNIANTTNLLILNALPQGKVEIVPASYQRAINAMRNSYHSVCVPNRVKTKARLAEFLFSLPVSVYITRRLYQHASEPPLDENLLDQNGQVKSLPALFEHYSSKTIVFTPTMSYGPFFDEQFKDVPTKNKVPIVGSNPYDDMYRMFKLKRANFLLGYPAEVYRQLQSEEADYIVYDVADAPRYTLGYWMCNKNQQSREFLELFDSLMLKIYASDLFYNAHTDWLPESAKKQTTAYLDELIRMLTSGEQEN
ncbi:hypothetical protein ACSLBF_19050 (plasmid) [Pseudoalteromonas sp. T1lg65]|uniref:hypothetical protein n=1 Tax=Pseudoalteromonas sp. T1lg65 TaxID=2077101 RepID=UPI003F79B854